MCSALCYQCIRQPLSDDSAAEILDFLQVFTNDFENRYGNQIRRYYENRSSLNVVRSSPSMTTDDPPF